MKRIISLVMALLLICTMGVFTASAATVTIDEIACPNSSKIFYTETDTITITGTATAGKDVVLRVYDNLKGIIYTDIFPAKDNIDGKFEFPGFKVAKIGKTDAVAYVVNVSVDDKNATEPATKTIEVVDKVKESNNPGGGEVKTIGWEEDGPAVNPNDPVELPPDKPYEDPMKNKELWEKVGTVTSDNSAKSTINQLTKATNPDSLATEDVRNNVATAGEVMFSNISAKRVSVGRNNSLTLTDTTISSSDLSKLDKTMGVIEKAISDNKITLNREMIRELVLNVNFSKNTKATITISKKLIEKLEKVDLLTIKDNDFKVSYTVSELREMLGEKEEFSFEIDKSGMTKDTKKVAISFNTDQTQTVKISFPNLSGDTSYMAVVDENGNPVGGHYNYSTKSFEAKITESGVYQVVSNEKDFDDIKSKSEEMQKSIKILAAKGIIQGTSETTFSPDSTITRAEIAALLLRVLSQVDPNADGEFADVKETDWFYGTAGSAKKYGMIKGFEDNTFRGNNVIEKDQILTISSRVLQKEMRYKTPENIEEWLKFEDAAEIAEWARTDVALATMANIITRSKDNTINSTEPMTRGDAALIIMRLFYKIW